MLKIFSFWMIAIVSSLGAVPYNVGDYAQGGVIFWLDPSAEHGLVAAIEDQDGGAGIQWYNGSYVSTNALCSGVYLGTLNTATVNAIQGDGNYATSSATHYSVTVGGVTYADWYLPSIGEMNIMFQTANTINTTALQNGGTAFVQGKYWSSSENYINYAANQDFTTGTLSDEDKSFLYHTRAIRKF